MAELPKQFIITYEFLLFDPKYFKKRLVIGSAAENKIVMVENRNASIYHIFSQKIELLFCFENKCEFESSVSIFMNGINRIGNINCLNKFIIKVVETGHSCSDEKPDTPMFDNFFYHNTCRYLLRELLY